MTQPNFLQNLLGTTVPIKGIVDNTLASTCVSNPSTCCGVNYPTPAGVNLIDQLTYEVTTLTVPPNSIAFRFNSDVAACCDYSSGVGGIAVGVQVRENTIALPPGTGVSGHVCNNITADKPCGGSVSITCPVPNTDCGLFCSAYPGNYTLTVPAATFSSTASTFCSQCSVLNNVTYTLEMHPRQTINGATFRIDPNDFSGYQVQGGFLAPACSYISGGITSGNCTSASSVWQCDSFCTGLEMGGISGFSFSSPEIGAWLFRSEAVTAPTTSVTLNPTAGGNTFTFTNISSGSLLGVGFTISDPGNFYLPPGTTITNISPTTLTVSNNILNTSSNVVFNVSLPGTYLILSLWSLTLIGEWFFPTGSFSCLGSSTSTANIWKYVWDQPSLTMKPVCGPSGVNLTLVAA